MYFNLEEYRSVIAKHNKDNFTNRDQPFVIKIDETFYVSNHTKGDDNAAILFNFNLFIPGYPEISLKNIYRYKTLINKSDNKYRPANGCYIYESNDIEKIGFLFEEESNPERRLDIEGKQNNLHIYKGFRHFYTIINATHIPDYEIDFSEIHFYRQKKEESHGRVLWCLKNGKEILVSSSTDISFYDWCKQNNREDLIFDFQYVGGLSTEINYDVKDKSILFDDDTSVCWKCNVCGQEWHQSLNSRTVHNIQCSSDICRNAQHLRLISKRVSEFASILQPSVEALMQVKIGEVKFNREIQLPYPKSKNVKGKYKSEFSAFRDVLSLYDGADIEKEEAWLAAAPNLITGITEFLTQLKILASNFIPGTSNEKKYKFFIEADYNIDYYRIAKLADNALEVSVNDNNSGFFVTFSSMQVEELELMHKIQSSIIAAKEYSIPEQKRKPTAEKDLLNRVRSDLETLSPNYYIFSTIDKLRSVLWEINGYSHIYTNLLLSLIKNYHNTLNERLIALYSQMAKEGRIQTKWSSEYKLFILISSLIGDAVYQYRADFLGAQSYDIYIPSQRIAIEYQGEQHYMPVEHFGGEDSHQSNLSRDERKRQLSAEHGVNLFEWRYDISVNRENVLHFLEQNGISYSLDLATQKPCGSVMAPVIEPPAKKNYVSKNKPREPKLSKEVIRKYTVDGVFLEEYSTIVEAAINNNIGQASIQKVLSGVRNTAAGFQWIRVKRDSDRESIQPVSIRQQVESTAVIQLDFNGNVIATHNSLSSAAKAISADKKNISTALDNPKRSAGGYRWRRANRT